MATQRTFTAEEVQKKFNSLPEEVQDMIYSTEFTAIIQKVGEKNKLHYDQMGRLEMETRNVLLGFTETSDFTAIVVNTLEVEQSVATAIAQDLNDLLFSKIRENMKNATTTVSAPEKISTPPAMSAVPAPAHASEGKSVVMPSAAKTVGAEMAHATPAANPVTPAPVAPQPTAPATAMFTIPAVPKPTELAVPHVDAMLSQPTVSIAPLNPASAGSGDHSVSQNDVAKPTPDIKKSDAPAAPPIYKTDPYHEPID